MGLLVVSSAMMDDVVGWLIFSVILGLIGKGGSMPLINTVFSPWICDLYVDDRPWCTKPSFALGE